MGGWAPAAATGAPLARIRSEMLAFLDELAWGGAGEAARKIARAVEGGTLDIATVCAASLARDAAAARALASEAGLNVQVLWMAIDLVTAPVANALQSALLESGDERVREAVAAWSRGTCPACDNWPALAEFFFGERLHRCAFCAAAWRLESRGCTYCGEAGEHFRTIPVDRPARQATRGLPPLRWLPQDHRRRPAHAVSLARHRGFRDRRPRPRRTRSRVQKDGAPAGPVAAPTPSRCRSDSHPFDKL
jgi:hypothetical protein